MEKVRPHNLAAYCQRTPAHIYVTVDRTSKGEREIYVRVIKKEFLALLREMPNTKFVEATVGFERITVKL